MTTNPERRSDEFVGDLIDGDIIDGGCDMSDLTREEIERIADLQLVHSLLVRSRAGQDEVIDREARIRAVMTRMRTEPIEAQFRLGPALHRMVTSRSMQLAVAACLVLALGLTWLIRTESAAVAARAAVEQAMAVSEQSRDRTYTVAFMAGEETLKQGLLRLRGSDRFVFERPMHDGQNVYMGRDEDGLWMCAPQHWAGDEVRRPTDEREIRRWLRGLDAPMPFLTTGNALRNFREHYRPTGSRKDPITGLFHVRGTRKEVDLSDPDLVELWIDRESGLVHRIELGWSEGLREKMMAHRREQMALKMQERAQQTDEADPGARQRRAEMRQRMGERWRGKDGESRRGPDGEPRRHKFRHPNRIFIELIDETPLDDSIFRPESYQ